jgi:hypothetical protein
VSADWVPLVGAVFSGVGVLLGIFLAHKRLLADSRHRDHEAGHVEERETLRRVAVETAAICTKVEAHTPNKNDH